MPGVVVRARTRLRVVDAVNACDVVVEWGRILCGTRPIINNAGTVPLIPASLTAVHAMARMTYEEKRGVFAEFKSVVASKNEELIRSYLVEYPFLHNWVLDPHHNRIMHIVCRLGFASCAEVIRSSHLHILKNRDGKTPLHIACESCSVECVRVLVQRWSVTPPVHRQHVSTPLHVACLHGHTEIVNILLEGMISEGILMMNAVDEHICTPIRVAVKHCRYDVVDLLLDCEHINTRRQDIHGQTLLHAVADEFMTRHPRHAITPAESRRKFRMVSRIFKACAGCINTQDRDGNSPLHLACKSKHVSTLKMCLAVPEVDMTLMNDEGDMPAHVLARYGTPSMWKLAIACPAFELNVATTEGKSLMDLAWSHAGTNVGRMIVESGRYDVDRAYRGQTALTSTLSQYFIPKRISCVLPRCSDETILAAATRTPRERAHMIIDEIRVRQRWGFCVDRHDTHDATRHHPGVRCARSLVVHALVLLSKRGFGRARHTRMH